MKFAHKFLIFLFLALTLVVGVNIAALQFFTTRYFADYLESVQQRNPEINFEVISSLLNNKTLDDATIREYVMVMNDLSALSQSLEEFSVNPTITDPPLLESLRRIGVSSDTIERYVSLTAVSDFVDSLSTFSVLRGDTPESVFVLRILQSILLVNIALFVLIIAIAYIWVRVSFLPIRSIIQNLANISKKKQYGSIDYTRNDEFHALVSAINDLNRSLSYQEKIRSEFLSDLSHEIKTPISAIKCSLEGIEDGIIAPDSETIAHLREDIDRLVSITNSIMEYEKLENSPDTAIRPSNIDAAGIARRIATEYEPGLRPSGQSIALFGQSGFVMWFDRDKWVSIVHNVYSNFAKYGGSDSTLSVVFEKLEDIYRVRFADNGRGVASSEVAYLTEKFYQVEKSRNRSGGGGIGIGLSIVDRIVRLHGGILSIESAPNAGFALTIDIPHGGFTRTAQRELPSQSS
ncbi:MAG TPA: HAMP domain-containing sensor histidine kinase [bacterium]|nr:HAMP domain-containing sensor histidine kinase [bacterium]